MIPSEQSNLNQNPRVCSVFQAERWSWDRHRTAEAKGNLAAAQTIYQAWLAGWMDHHAATSGAHHESRTTQPTAAPINCQFCVAAKLTLTTC